MEQIDYHLLFRRSTGLGTDETSWDPTVFAGIHYSLKKFSAPQQFFRK